MTIEKRTNDPESVRNEIDKAEAEDFQNPKTGVWYTVKDGELKQIGGEDGKQEATSEAA